MKKSILASVLVYSFAMVAHADIIKCDFTEPFLDVQYSTTTNELTVSAFMGGGKDKDVVTVTKNVSFQIKSAGQFELLSKDKKVIMTLELNNKGSNGMSDTIYPFDATIMDTGEQKSLQGGCESNYLRATKEDKASIEN